MKKEKAKINWDQTALQLHNFIRGNDKIPGAWTSINGEVCVYLKFQKECISLAFLIYSACFPELDLEFNQTFNAITEIKISYDSLHHCKEFFLLNFFRLASNMIQ